MLEEDIIVPESSDPMTQIDLLDLEDDQQTSDRCQRGEDCWPSPSEVRALRQALEPELPRSLVWKGPKTPRVCGVPINASGEQPLYGAGSKLAPLEVQDEEEATKLCFEDEPWSHYCNITVRNRPAVRFGSPAFVVWPLKASHVQTAVQFAKQHRLCISVVGAGHDYLSRHSCPQGLMIRTSLLNSIHVSLSPNNSFNHPDGVASFGSGLVVSQAQHLAAQHDRFIASGWDPTVGILGWYTGGGHGLFTRSLGLGVNNLVQVEIVVADGRLVLANSQTNPELFWALKGGGGSTWGVITSLTVKLHKLPSAGFTFGQHIAVASLQPRTVRALIDGYMSWGGTLSSRWANLLQISTMEIPDHDQDPAQCGAWATAGCTSWSMLASTKRCQQDSACAASPLSVWQRCPTSCGVSPGAVIVSSLIYNYIGSKDDQDYLSGMSSLKQNLPDALAAGAPIQPVNLWEAKSMSDPDGFLPVGPIEGRAGAMHWGSVLLNSTVTLRAGLAAKYVYKDLSSQGPRFAQFYHVGGAGSVPKPIDNPISTTFCQAVYHYVFRRHSVHPPQYDLGEFSSFAEGAFEMPTFKQRYWDQHYPRLLATKQRWDPHKLFWCHHCVGDEEPMVLSTAEK